MCLLKKDMEVIKSAQLSYASYSVPIALSHAALTEADGTLFEAEERAGVRPLCLESPLLCLRRAEGVLPVGTRQYRSVLGFPVRGSTAGEWDSRYCRALTVRFPPAAVAGTCGTRLCSSRAGAS